MEARNKHWISLSESSLWLSVCWFQMFVLPLCSIWQINILQFHLVSSEWLYVKVGFPKVLEVLIQHTSQSFIQKAVHWIITGGKVPLSVIVGTCWLQNTNFLMYMSVDQVASIMHDFYWPIFKVRHWSLSFHQAKSDQWNRHPSVHHWGPSLSIDTVVDQAISDFGRLTTKQ